LHSVGHLRALDVCFVFAIPGSIQGTSRLLISASSLVHTQVNHKPVTCACVFVDVLAASNARLLRDHFYMRHALKEARAALAMGEVPVGCVLVRDCLFVGGDSVKWYLNMQYVDMESSVGRFAMSVLWPGAPSVPDPCLTRAPPMPDPCPTRAPSVPHLCPTHARPVPYSCRRGHNLVNRRKDATRQ
jgi:hypothetical protein